MLKAFFVSIVLFFIPGCDARMPFSAAERVPPKLEVQFPDAKVQGVLYERQHLRQLELLYPRSVTEPETLRLQIQSFLIDELTQKEHPEGNCVQVEHVLRAQKSVFKVLVVCVN